MESTLAGIRQKKDQLVDGLIKNSGGKDRETIMNFRDIKETELINVMVN